jgi:hypothetical protein
VYIPPKQSTYSSEEAFNELEDEIIAVSKNTKHIALVDDLNSKTSTLEDSCFLTHSKIRSYSRVSYIFVYTLNNSDTIQ